MLRRMLDRQVILKCHLFVPVWFWPVLWHSLMRLQATILLNRERGGGSFAWTVDRTGIIRITWRADSPEDRLARGEIFHDVEREPWRRLTLDAPARAVIFALACLRPETGPVPAHDRPVTGLPFQLVRAPP